MIDDYVIAAQGHGRCDMQVISEGLTKKNEDLLITSRLGNGPKENEKDYS